MEDAPIDKPSRHDWLESNVLWGGIGTVLTVVAAMKHNLCWLLIFAWLCFIYTAWNGTRKLTKYRWPICILVMVTVTCFLIWLKIYLCPSSGGMPPVASITKPMIPAPQAQKVPDFIPRPVILPRAKLPISPVKTEVPASAQAPTYELKCEGSACAQGPGAQATFNQFGARKLVITESEIIALREALKPYSGISINMVSFEATPDTDIYIGNLLRIFSESGIAVNGPSGGMDTRGVPYGASLFLSPDRLPEAKAIAEALHIPNEQIRYDHPTLGSLYISIRPYH